MFRKAFYLFGALTLFANFSYPQSSSGQDAAPTEKQMPRRSVPGRINLIEGNVTLVHDGDVISVEAKDGKTFEVRLQGIDAPDDNQNYNKKARKNLAQLVLNKEVKVVVYRQDLLDRYVGSVFLDGQDVSLIQLEAGLAWHDKQYSYQQTADQRKRYAQAEARAREDKIGLWEDDQPVAPWNFREGKKTPDAAVKADVHTAPAAAATPETPAKPGERKYIRGPRGGCYYISASGKKNYVDHAYCN